MRTPAMAFSLVTLVFGCTDDAPPVCAEGQVRLSGLCVDYDPDPPVSSEGLWRPTPGTSWQWQLTEAIDPSFDVEMYDVDLFNVSDEELESLSDRVVICYFSAGTWEAWRDDADDFPAEAIGQALPEWPNERWLDLTNATVREVMLARLDLAVLRGCDGVEPDNVDGYANVNGVGLNATEQLAFNRFIADAAHERGLSVGLKNDLDQIEDLVDWFDWALNEECAAYDECDRLALFTNAGKAVFHVEYVDSWDEAEGRAAEVCGRAPDLDTLIKLWDLGPERLACP